MEDFSRVESLLRSLRFDEETVCRSLGIASLADLGSVRRDTVDLARAGSGALALLFRLFLFIEPVPRGELAAALDNDALNPLLALDLLRPGPPQNGAETYCATVLLYPVAGLLIASDRHENPDRSPFVPPADVVFPAIFGGTLRFLQVLPTSPAADVLDLCAGTGIGALVLSRHASRVVAADITGRAAHFARFNRLLNRCPNVEVAQGDLYEAVEGRNFDRIVAHPPYVPAATATQIFRDAGETGEAILRRIIEGLPQFLRCGGAFYSVCAGWDAKDVRFEERVHTWLGATRDEFDVLFAVHHEMSPADVARGLAERARSNDPAQLADWRQVFGEAGVERRVYGALVIDRPGAPGASRPSPIRRRLRLSPLTDASSFEWMLRWLRRRETLEACGELEASAGFWSDQERSQKLISEKKSARAVVEPIDSVAKSIEEVELLVDGPAVCGGDADRPLDVRAAGAVRRGADSRSGVRERASRRTDAGAVRLLRFDGARGDDGRAGLPGDRSTFVSR